MTTETAELVRQHLIDPEICIRCNTCQEMCPIDAIEHDANNGSRETRTSERM